MNVHAVPKRASMRLLVLVFCLMSAGGCATNRVDSARRHLDSIFEAYFAAYLKLYPTVASDIGDHSYDGELEIAIAENHIAEQRRLAAQTLERLEEIALHDLDAQRRLSYDLLRYHLTDNLAGLQFKSQLLPVRQLANLAVEFPLMTSPNGIHPFNTPDDYDNFLRRVDAFETWIDVAIDNMRRGVNAGIVQPRVVIERTLSQIEGMIVRDAKTSLFYRPILRLPVSFTIADRERLAREYAHAIERKLVPAYGRMAKFLRDEYLAVTRSTVAWTELPGGASWYDYWVRNQTTTAMAPEEIYDLGVAEIERIRGEMDRLRRASGFQGTLRDYSRYLSDQSARLYSNRADLIRAYEEIERAVRPHIGRLFGRLPNARFEIRTIEEYREQSAPSQYWSAPPDGSRPGIFYVNARGIEVNPRRASESLFLHEAIPGHHFQISIQREQAGLPRFQRFTDYNAFSEGWALYAESLGAELGLYTDASQNFSRLNSELFRAVRLVVDVGLHRKGWSRQQAIQFIIETTGGSEPGASLEVDRYIALPAQALGYKIGQLKIAAIRAKAERELGDGFDIRAFHDELLKDGALPLIILDSKMDRWIAGMKFKG